MERSIEEIEQLINNGTFYDILINDCEIEYQNNKINIIFPNWLNLLEDSSKNKIISIIKINAPIIIQNMYPNSKVLL